mgnify:CR=1 FL=1
MHMVQNLTWFILKRVYYCYLPTKHLRQEWIFHSPIKWSNIEKKAMLLYKYKKGQRSDFAMFVTFMVMQRWHVSTLYKQSTLGLLSNMTAHGGNVETVIVLGSDTSGSGSTTGCVSSCVFMARVNRDISLDICNKKHKVVMSRCKIRDRKNVNHVLGSRKAIKEEITHLSKGKCRQSLIWIRSELIWITIEVAIRSFRNGYLVILLLQKYSTPGLAAK